MGLALTSRRSTVWKQYSTPLPEGPNTNASKTRGTGRRERAASLAARNAARSSAKNSAAAATPGRNCTGVDVDIAAGGKRHHDAHRFRRIGLRPGSAASQRQHGGDPVAVHFGQDRGFLAGNQVAGRGQGPHH